MLIQNINDKLKIIYTPNKKADFNTIGRSLGYIKSDNKPREGVTINHFGSYFPVGGTSSISSVEIKEKGEINHIIDDSVFFDYSRDDMDLILRNMRYFGNKFSLNVDNKMFEGDFYKESDISLKNNKRNVIIFETSSSKKMTPRMHDFMHKMRMNNSRMIMPLVRKYANVINVVGKNRRLITGYANMLNYMDFMKTPNRDFLRTLTGQRGDCNVYFERPTSRITLKVSGTYKDSPVLDFLVNNMPYVANKKQDKTPVPYILLNTKPIQLLNQKMIYFTAKYKKTTVFVIPMMFKSDDALKNLRGGFNLLS